jgi:repressor LexA
MKMRSNDEIIRYLTQLKNEQQLTISEIARRTGMAKSAISRYFNKSREFPVNKVDDFAKVFNVTPEEILGIKKETDGLSVDEAVDNLRAYQGKPISDDEKEVLKDIIKGYLDRR